VSKESQKHTHQESHHYKLVFFDNDGTLTSNRVAWVYMHEYLGTWEQGRSLLEYHIENKTPYDEFAHESVKLWKGIPKEKFIERLMTIGIRPGIHKVMGALHAEGMKLAVLSSGFSLWKDVWLEREGIVWDYYMANDLLFDENDICTGKIIMNVTDNVPGSDKGSLVEDISRLEGVSKAERVFVGDGRGDIFGFRHCAFGIAIDPENEEVKKTARYVIKGDEFEKIIGLIIG
jgi:phosphoserine phosphatase